MVVVKVRQNTVDRGSQLSKDDEEEEEEKEEEEEETNIKSNNPYLASGKKPAPNTDPSIHARLTVHLATSK